MVIAFPLASFTAFDTLPSAVEEASCRPTAQKPTKRPKKWHIWPRLRRRLPRAVSKKQPSARTPGEQVHGKVFFAPPGDCSRAGGGWHSTSGTSTPASSRPRKTSAPNADVPANGARAISSASPAGSAAPRVGPRAPRDRRSGCRQDGRAHAGRSAPACRRTRPRANRR